MTVIKTAQHAPGSSGSMSPCWKSVAVNARDIAMTVFWLCLTSAYYYQFLWKTGLIHVSKYDLLASVVVVQILRWREGGKRSMLQELRGIASDFVDPFRLCFRPLPVASAQSSRYASVLLALCRVTSYKTVYGPLAPITKKAFLLPPLLFVDILQNIHASALRVLTGNSTATAMFHLTYVCRLLGGMACVALTWAVSHLIYFFLISKVLHLYFSHGRPPFPWAKKAQLSRGGKLAFAIVSCAADQRGPLWWASIHRRHHKHCDTDQDPHSPVGNGFWWSHFGWIIDRRNYDIRQEYILDYLTKNPELVLVDFLASAYPVLSSTFISSMVLNLLEHLPTENYMILIAVLNAIDLGNVTAWHSSFSTNSLSHHWKRRATAKCQARDFPFSNWFSQNIWLPGEVMHKRHHQLYPEGKDTLWKPQPPPPSLRSI